MRFRSNHTSFLPASYKCIHAAGQSSAACLAHPSSSSSISSLSSTLVPPFNVEKPSSAISKCSGQVVVQSSQPVHSGRTISNLYLAIRSTPDLDCQVRERIGALILFPCPVRSAEAQGHKYARRDVCHVPGM